MTDRWNAKAPIVRVVQSARFIVAVVASLALLSFAHSAHAESVVWNTTLSKTFAECDNSAPGFGGGCMGAVKSPAISITYNVRATDAATGANVCNTTVPFGTKIKFEFVPHVYTDISWVGTGFDYDSPYGDWSASAAPPPAADTTKWCNDNNFISPIGSRRAYVLLQVAPPQKTLVNTTGLTCGTPAADGTLECTASTAGAVLPQFQFQSTIGKWYFALDFGGGQCYPAGRASR